MLVTVVAQHPTFMAAALLMAESFYCTQMVFKCVRVPIHLSFFETENTGIFG